MNCENCGIKIMASLARQQEGGENLCRECYIWKLARENDEAGAKMDVEEEIARTEESHERTAWRQRLYDLEGE